MAISDKLNYLIETKQLFKDRLNSLGAEITSSTTFRNYLNWLDTFYGEVSDKTDLSVNGVVGRTSQESTTGKNLAIFEQPDTTISDLTIIYDNATGKISIKGKATATTEVRVSKQMQTNIPSGTYTLSVNSALPTLINYVVTDSQNNNTAFRMSAGSTSVTNTLSNNGVQASLFVAIENNVQYDLEFYMQLESGSTATDFEPFTYGASPNPDYPQPINNLSGNVSYKVCGKNKFNLDYEVETQYKTEGNVVSPKYILNNNQIEILQSNVQYGRYFFNKLLLDVGTYTLSWIPSLSGTDKRMNYSVRNLDTSNDIVINARMDIVDNEKYSISFTLNEKQYVTFSLQPATNDSGTLTLKNIQLEKNSTATSYEPYIEPQTFDIPLGDIELCKIDTYEDKIYSSNGRFYLAKNINSTIINGTEPNFTADNKPSELTYYSYNLYNDNFVMPSSVCYCDKLLYSENSLYSNDIQGIKPTSTGRIKIKVFDSSLSTVGLFKAWLSNNNLLMYYIINTATTTEITQENYPSLYNALKQIQDYLTSYKINKEFILGYSSPEIEY